MMTLNNYHSKKTVTIPNYQITETIYSGSRTIVYRAVRIDDQRPVVIKLLKNPYPSFSELVQFRNQYTLAKNLNSPLIIKTYSLEPYQNSYALVMEDFGGISLKKWLIQQKNVPPDLINFFKIAITLCEILDFLYNQRIIHKDIKPGNILIHPESQQVKLIDFSIASLLLKETQTLISPNLLEGTLAYISPEQTGRMNRGIDYRSDLYSLGVTFYELLTGELPFKSNDPIELIYSHIAKMPKPIGESQEGGNRGEIPSVLSDIVMKLMAKNAEDRYQSAWGLKQDLENCLTQLQETGQIEDFEIGRNHQCDRFLIPDKLYGRETEVKTLLQAFERVSKGATEIILVAGFSGIGKTAVVNEVHKPILRQRGYFIKGKFDQFQRNIPFSAFVQAFQDLIEQLLTESDAKIQIWKSKILDAFGTNGKVILEVIPSLEKIIGSQSPAPELSGIAAQNRFNLLFQKFTQVFTSAEHPLVIFLDDLQWADSASLKLIQLLIANTGHLLLIGAYRDNETGLASSQETRPTQYLLNPVHPLMLTLSEIQKTQAKINTITLVPLSQEQVNQLVAETLKCTENLAQPLSQLVFQKTQGNPFFATQFLQALHQEKLIKYNLKLGFWEYDITQINQQRLTDDVVEFMVLQLEKLPLSTQNILKLAACIGNQFDLATLAIVSEKSEIEIATDLWNALQEGLILPTRDIYKFYFSQENQSITQEMSQAIIYKFSHDRVQQTAYSLIPNDQKQTTHYHIGQLLLKRISPDLREERIFELVNHLNYGIALIPQQKERDELAQFNLIACRKARSATAYQVSREYARIGLSLLGEKAWERQYQMSLAFSDLAAELAALCGDFQAMEQLIETVIFQAKSCLDLVFVYRLKISTNFSCHQQQKSISIAQEILQKLEIIFPEYPTKNDIQQAVLEVENLIGERDIGDLVNLPRMTDQEKIAIVKIINSVIPSAYVSGSPLFPLLAALSVKLSIQYGNTSASAFGYVIYGMFACNFLQDIETGVKFGQLALEVASKLDAKASQPEVLDVFGGFILYRQSHLKETLPLVQTGYTLALEVGSFEVAGYNANKFCLNSFWCSQPLVILESETRAYCLALVQLHQLSGANYCRIYWQSILNLLGLSENPTLLSGEALEETEFLPLLISSNDLYGLFTFYLNKIMLCYGFEEIELANHYTVAARNNLIGGAGSIGEAAFYFYDSLIILALWSPRSEIISSEQDQSKALEQVQQNQTQLQQYWANYAPMNYQHKVDLVEAEKCRVLEQHYQAAEWYDRAIAGAKKNEYIQEEALANELAAQFYLNRGKETIAAGYMQEAYYCYARWGAKAKIADLERRYPQLLAAILQHNRLGMTSVGMLDTTLIKKITSSSRDSNMWLDFPAVMQAAQAISQEIELEKLLATLMQIALTNAGAQRGNLILHQDEQWFVVAEAEQDQTKDLKTPLKEYQKIPQTLIESVVKTKATAVFDNLSDSEDFSAYHYIMTYKPKSVLCTPMSRQGKLIGILYLENNLTVGAFSSDRITILQLLISQASISLENARLYQQTQNYSQILEAKVEQKTQDIHQKAQDLEQALKKLQQTQTQLIQAEKMSSLGQLVAGIAHEINNPINFIQGNIVHLKMYLDDLLKLLNFYQQEFPQSSAKIQEILEEIEFDFVCRDVYKILDSFTEGSNRISDIVLSLRNFSRLDEAEFKFVDIHSGIDSTLLIFHHRLKGNHPDLDIEVIKEYGQLPLVKCYASALNQVFMNILSNALDALEQVQKTPHYKNQQPTITIRTFLENNDNIVVSIADNGPGIEGSVLARIFDPFFTTKPVGSGTGLGLSISYSIIVEKHQGQLICISTPGEGAEFIIKIPVSNILKH